MPETKWWKRLLQSRLYNGLMLSLVVYNIYCFCRLFPTVGISMLVTYALTML
jgi:hypothetical protein